MKYFSLQRLGYWSVVLALVGPMSTAHAATDGDRAAARRLGYAGVEAYQAGRYAAATEQLEKAYAVLHVPSIGLWSARALVHNGKLVEASERYLEIARIELNEGDTKVQRRAQEDAARELLELNKRVPSVTVVVEGSAPAEVKLTIDGVAFSSALVNEPRPVNPGLHVVRGTRAAERTEVSVQVDEANHQTARLVFHPPVQQTADQPILEGTAKRADAVATGDTGEPASWSTGKTAAVALGVVGIGGAAVAVVEAIAFNRKARESRDHCNVSCTDPALRQQASEERASAKSAQTIGIAAGLVGGASFIAAGVLWLTSGRRADSDSAMFQMTPSVTPNAVNIAYTGRW